MMTVWSCTCARCGKEIADGDRQALDFKRGGWQYNRETREWICDECADSIIELGKARLLKGKAARDDRP